MPDMAWDIEPRKDVKLFVGCPIIPSFQYIHTRVQEAWEHAWKPPQTVRVFERSFGVASAREKLADTFLDGDWTHLLWLDADIMVRENTIKRLIEVDREVCTGLYYETSDRRQPEAFHHCFTGDTKVKIKNKNGFFAYSGFKDLYSKRGYRYTTGFLDGKEIPAEIVRRPLENNESIYTITLKNGFEIVSTFDHPHVTDEGLILTKDLSPNHYLKIRRRIENEDLTNGNYDWGFLVGLYGAEGSKHPEENACEIAMKETDENIEVLMRMEKIVNSLGLPVNKHRFDSLITYNFNSVITKFITHFVQGFYANEKYLTTAAYNTSVEFRKGIFDGWFYGDAGKSNKVIYTVSEEGALSLSRLLLSLGKLPAIYTEEIEKNFMINGKEAQRNFTTMYGVRAYKSPFSSGAAKYIKRGENESELFIKIKEITIWNAPPDMNQYVYCLKTADPHLFELANNIITHNSQVPFRRDAPIDFKKNEYFEFPDNAEDYYLGGLGLVMFKREVFDKIEKPYFLYSSEYESKLKDDFASVSEDFYVLLKLQKAGIKITYIPDILVGHCGECVVQGPNQINFL